MSKRYLASSWCRDELEWFRKQIQDRAGEPGRVFVIRAQPTDTGDVAGLSARRARLCDAGLFVLRSGDRTSLGLAGSARDRPRLRQGNVPTANRLDQAVARIARSGRKARPGGSRREAASPAIGVPHSGARRIYLHAPSDCEPARADIGRVLTQDGIVPLTARVSAEGGLASWQRESGARMETAKRCEALALLRPEDGRPISSAISSTSASTSARGSPMRAARRCPARCSTTPGRACRSTSTPFGIEHFDVSRENWRGEFRRGSTPRGPSGPRRAHDRCAARRRAAFAALSRPAAVRGERMVDLLRPRAHDRRCDRSTCARSPRRRPRGFGLRQVEPRAGGRYAETRAPASCATARPGSPARCGLRAARCGISQPNSRNWRSAATISTASRRFMASSTAARRRSRRSRARSRGSRARACACWSTSSRSYSATRRRRAARRRSCSSN